MRPLVRKLAVFAILLGPCLALALFGAAGVAAGTTLWQEMPAEAADAAYPVDLTPGELYTVVVETACFTGSDYGVLVLVWDNHTGEVAHFSKGALFETRHGCRSTFETREFKVSAGENLTAEWNLSREVFAHGARVRLVARLVSLDDSLEMVVMGVWVGAFMVPVSLLVLDWMGKRPPRRGRDPERAPSPGGGYPAPG